MTAGEKSLVALVPCADYDEARVYEAVKTGLALLGGAKQFLNPEEQVLLKPNLLRKSDPALAVTTHPAVFGAVAQVLREEGCARIAYGDSPGGVAVSAKKAAQGAGLSEEVRKYALEEADFITAVKTEYPEAALCHQFTLCAGVLGGPAIVNLPKLKTHALERMTGAVKNLLGAVCGTSKALLHPRYPDPDSFAKMLVDLNALLRPRLHIMDGIVAMEGNGPGSGTPVGMGVLLFSADPVALDSVVCALVNLSPAAVPTNVQGQKLGLGNMDWDRISVLTPGETLSVEAAAARWGKPDFDVYRGDEKSAQNGRFLQLLRERPVIDKNTCVHCGACVEACPVEPKALAMEAGKVPAYSYSRCIRCYCCQEFCPKKAISVHKPLLSRLLLR